MRWLEWLAPKRAGGTKAEKKWPNYIFGGRMRTSTATLIVAFFALFWVNQTFQPAPSATQTDPTQVVPPGFVPDPAYTWVPRTNVAPRDTTTTTTRTTTTTTTPSPTPTPSESETPTPTSTTGTAPGGATTTVIDPDGPGPLGPVTFTQAPPLLAPTSVAPPGAPAITTALPPQ
ncbi:MAG: hypothetical protein PGN37_10140 [Mycobacterium kyogaense]|uniref:hypothetical protein n=1 Tax=Mycobacterium kyogaense TaxID=2212479 RepID=UPI002FFBB7AE